MSSVIFQPLLHDPLGWKASNTTYADHYQWRKQRLTRKDKIVSPYGQKFQRELQRQKEQQAKSAHRSTPSLIVVPKIEEEPIPYRISSVKKVEEEQEEQEQQRKQLRPSGSSKSIRQTSSKSLRIATPEEVQSTTSVEAPVAVRSTSPTRAASVQRENSNLSRVSQRSTHTAVATEDVPRSTTRLERRSAQRDETTKSIIIDANNDNSRHWLTYPNPKTPQNIIDTKIRLGQMKTPAVLARAKSALYASLEDTRKTPQLTDRTETMSVPQPTHKPKTPDQRHFLDFNLPETPDDLRAARQRIDKHRYNPSLDGFPQRPQTCPDRLSELITKPKTPAVILEQTQPEEKSSTNEQEAAAPTTSDENAENSTSDDENATVVIQPLNTEGVPSEYVEALETANAVQEEYMKLLKQNAEKKSEQFVYRLPAMPVETKSSNSSAHRQRQQSSSALSASSHQSLRQQDFGAWVRQASDQERHTAMKILHDVLTKPVTNDDILPSSIPSASRSRSAAGRKLGRVRTQPRFVPDQQNDQNYIQQDVWHISRSDGMISTHPHPGTKTSIVQV